MDLAFIILSLITLVGALWAVTLRNLFHSVLSVILFFLGIAGFFFYLRADFVGWVQILIYVGAVAILALFAIMLTRHITGEENGEHAGMRWLTGLVVAGSVGSVLWTAVHRNSTLSGQSQPDTVASVADIGRRMMTDWVVPFEVISILLTAAMIGAIVIAMEQLTRQK